MLRRTLILSVCLAAVLAVVGVTGASAKPSEKFTFTLPAIPGITKTPIDFACVAKLDSDGKTLEVDCHNTGGPNPYPPKDKKVYKLGDTARSKLTLYPDGEVTLIAFGAID